MSLKIEKKVDAIYLDYAQAFDTVPHKRLLAKLSGYGIGGKPGADPEGGTRGPDPPPPFSTILKKKKLSCH